MALQCGMVSSFPSWMDLQLVFQHNFQLHIAVMVSPCYFAAASIDEEKASFKVKAFCQLLNGKVLSTKV